ncbi:unnamed protein product [Auanema sp. JU1783]|nr:unnamed protein product [Auanema sp. JU1783]
MATIRQGLKTVSGNSPAIGQFQLNKSQESIRSPSKLLLKKTFLPSPMIREENKENCSQTPDVKLSSCEVQTEVSTMEPAKEITEEDLESEVETVNYWKNLHEESLREMEHEANRTLELLTSLDESICELRDTEDKLEVLKEVLADADLNDVNTSETL